MGSDGPQNKIIAVNIETGAVINSYLLDVPLQGDWESMSLGPCSSWDKTTRCLYIGNMGNNLADLCYTSSCSQGNEQVYIYKLVEPDINAYYNGNPLKVTTLIINFSGSNFVVNRANSESLFVVRYQFHVYVLLALQGNGKTKKISKLTSHYSILSIPCSQILRTTPAIKRVESQEISILLPNLRRGTICSALVKYPFMTTKAYLLARHQL